MTWKVDPTHSSIQFGVKHMLVATTRGAFRAYDVEAEVDETDLARSQATVRIDAASIDTGMEMRDNHLRSPDFFDAERHPQITFRTKRLEPRGGDAYRVVGDLTIRDVTQEVVLDGELAAPITDPFGQRRAGISAEGKVNRKAFGLSWNGPVEAGGVLVGDQVKLTIDLEFTKDV